jgi:hypothetical protein
MPGGKDVAADDEIQRQKARHKVEIWFQIIFQFHGRGKETSSRNVRTGRGVVACAFHLLLDDDEELPLDDDEDL